MCPEARIRDELPGFPQCCLQKCNHVRLFRGSCGQVHGAPPAVLAWGRCLRSRTPSFLRWGSGEFRKGVRYLLRTLSMVDDRVHRVVVVSGYRRLAAPVGDVETTFGSPRAMHAVSCVPSWCRGSVARATTVAQSRGAIFRCYALTIQFPFRLASFPRSQWLRTWECAVDIQWVI